MNVEFLKNQEKALSRVPADKSKEGNMVKHVSTYAVVRKGIYNHLFVGTTHSEFFEYKLFIS